jgi:serine kinase of HPr protein (carbohydrate metabolism regulator)
MTSLREIIEKLNLEAVSSTHFLDRPVAGGYVADLLSCAMKRAKKDMVWVTLQSHVNIVAVASLLELAAVVITEESRPNEETLERAEVEGVVLIVTPKTSYTIVAELAGLGIMG